MSRIPNHELRRLGITSEDIDMARVTQEAQRRNGSPVQSIAVLVGAVQPRQRPDPNPPVDLTDRSLRRRGAYDQAALLLDQQALRESSPSAPPRPGRLPLRPRNCPPATSLSSTSSEGATCPSHSSIRTP